MLRVLIHTLIAALLAIALASVLIRIPPTSPMSHPHSSTRPSHHAATAAHIRLTIASYVSEIKSGANALDAAASGSEAGRQTADPREGNQGRRRGEQGIFGGYGETARVRRGRVRGIARWELFFTKHQYCHANLRDSPPPAGITLPPYKFASYDSPQTLMGHLARDWTEEGYANTEKTYDIVRDMLKRHLPPTMDREEHSPATNGDAAAHAQRVLLPGGGLSRLAFNLALEGYDVECNDLSPLMATVSALILSRSYSSPSFSSSTASLPTIYPPSTAPKTSSTVTRGTNSHPNSAPSLQPPPSVSPHLDNNLPFDPVKISIGGYAILYAGERADEQPDPDDQGFDGCPKCVAARDRKRAATRAVASSSTSTSIASTQPQFSALVASFFLDRAHSSPLLLLRHPLTPLRPGGILIVLGPLAWRADARPMMSWDEVKVWWEEERMEVLEETTVAGEYARGEGMMMYTERYVHPFIALRKPGSA